MRLQRVNVLLTGTAWTLALAVLGLHLAVSPSLPARVNVRWSEAAPAAQRARIEADLGLTSGAHQDGPTWSYVLRDASSTNIGRLVRHPLIEDTHHIDRATATLTVDASGRPAWVGDLARLSAFQASARWLPAVAAVFSLVGVAGLWPVWRRLVPRVWRYARWRTQTVIDRTRASTARLWHAARQGWRDTRADGLSARGRIVVALALIMSISFGLRLVLVVSGGQFYWGDESLYFEGREIAEALEDGDFRYPFQRIGNGQHPLFALIGAVPALVERTTHDDTRIPGAFFAAFSTLNIGLLALIARRSGAAPAEALVAGGLLALSNTFFYYARHLLPYDAAMSFGLLALYLGLGRGGRRPSVLCGIAAGCTFLTYGGYWTLGGAALVMHVIAAESRTAALRRALFGALGLAGMIATIVVGSAFTGKNIAGAMVHFAQSIDQGEFSEGWRLPWAYLWHAEHLMLVVWLLAVTWALTRIRSGALPGSARVGLLGLVFVYGSLVVTSVVMHRFVVYGRLARQMVPFLCLVTAAALYRARVSPAPGVQLLFARAVAVLLTIQAAFNFLTPLRQVFPPEFVRGGQGEAGIPGGADVIAINAKHLYPGPEPFTLPPRYSVLRRAPHPLQFLPYQYEGYTPSQRLALRSADIEMRLILVPRGSAGIPKP